MCESVSRNKERISTYIITCNRSCILPESKNAEYQRFLFKKEK